MAWFGDEDDDDGYDGYDGSDIFDEDEDGGDDEEPCEECGDWVPIGGWPFCASAHNPEGHAKGAAYAFKMRFPMKSQGWTRRER